jgi:hypothetical protein
MIHPWIALTIVLIVALVVVSAWWGSKIHRDNLDQLGGRTGADLGPDFWKNIR